MSPGKRIEDNVFAALLIVFFGAILINIDNLIGSFHGGNAFQIGPKAFPIVLCITALTLLTILFAERIINFVKIKKGLKSAETPEKEEPLSALYTLFGVVPAIFLFIFFSTYLGYLFCGVLLLVILQIIMGNYTWYKIVLFTGIVVITCYLVFIKLLYIELPRGMGIFENLSYYLY